MGVKCSNGSSDCDGSSTVVLRQPNQFVGLRGSLVKRIWTFPVRNLTSKSEFGWLCKESSCHGRYLGLLLNRLLLACLYSPLMILLGPLVFIYKNCGWPPYSDIERSWAFAPWQLTNPTDNTHKKTCEILFEIISNRSRSLRSICCPNQVHFFLSVFHYITSKLILFLCRVMKVDKVDNLNEG